jgi:hypothetical protein
MQRTFIARDFRANDIADLAAGGEICDYMHVRSVARIRQ